MSGEMADVVFRNDGDGRSLVVSARILLMNEKYGECVETRLTRLDLRSSLITYVHSEQTYRLTNGPAVPFGGRSTSDTQVQIHSVDEVPMMDCRFRCLKTVHGEPRTSTSYEFDNARRYASARDVLARTNYLRTLEEPKHFGWFDALPRK